MKLQSDWLIQTTGKLRGPGSRDEYEVLGWSVVAVNTEHEGRREGD